MTGLLRLLAAILVIGCAWNVGARLQVFDDARLFTRIDQAQYSGRVTRAVVTGDWIVHEAGGRDVTVPQENFGAMTSSGGITVWSVIVPLAGFAIALVIAFPGMLKALRDRFAG